MKVLVVGGGASGMVAAIKARENGHDVTIFEHMNRIGKKILATGNGKCNLTNMNLNISNGCCEYYYTRGNSKTKDELVNAVFEEFSYNDTLNFFNACGLNIRNREEYVYPYSEQASAVLDVLRFTLEEKKIKVITDIEIDYIAKKKDFFVKCKNSEYHFDRVIIACGSMAQPKLGSDGSGYKLAKSFNHRIIEPLPALVQIRCKDNYFKSIAGVRIKGSVSIKGQEESLWSSNTGEIQMTDYGISGIAAMNISGKIAELINNKKQVNISINIMPEKTKSEIIYLLNKRKNALSERVTEEFFVGLFNKNVGLLLLKMAGIDMKKKIMQLSDKELLRITSLIQDLNAEVIGVKTFDNCQICTGGIDISEVDKHLESKLVKGLFFAGEILDISGPCGGYNLQWAWSSGAVCGMHV